MRLTEEQYAALQAKAHAPVDELFHVARSKHRPRPNTALISEAAKLAEKKSKLKNIRCQSRDGTNFASKLERDYYEQLLLRWKAGEVLWFVRQPSFDLEGGVRYIADFLVVTKMRGDPLYLRGGVVVTIIDTTGVMTPTKSNKLKQLKSRYGLDVEIVRKS
jgi:hypothetical protein